MKIKKLLTGVLVCIMVVCSMAVSAFAAETTYEAQIGDTKYATLADAVEAGGNIVLLRDIELSARVNVEKTVTLDLAGKKLLAASDLTATRLLNVKAGGDLTINDTVGTGEVNYNGNTKVYAAIAVAPSDGTAKLTVNGGKFVGYYYGITGNGMGDGTTIVINGGDISSVEGTGSGIYHPQNGLLQINDGTISGATAVYFKSGSLEITGGKLSATGEAKDYGYTAGGSDATGDALVVDNVGGESGYEAIGTVSITGGTFKSASAKAVASYAIGDAPVVTGFITGGTFNTDVSAYVENGYELAKNEDGTYGVAIAYVAQIGDIKYATLAEAVAAAESGDTVTLLADVTIDAPITITDGMDLTISGEGKTITGAEGKDVFSVKGGKLTLTEGLNVYAPTDCCVYITGGEVVTAANLTKGGSKYSVIQGNGAHTGDVTITGGSVINEIPEKVAIYWPQNGTLTITGGEIKGGTAIRLSSGAMKITGGTFTANGTKNEYVASNGGSVADTGDAIMVENIGGDTGYEVISSVEITGGTFTSENAAAVASYTAGEEGVEAATGFITGGTFSSDVSALVANNCVYDANSGTVGIVEATLTTPVNFTKTKITTDEGKDAYKVSFLAGIDSLSYNRVGFIFTYGDADGNECGQVEVDSKKVYTSFTAAGTKYLPTDKKWFGEGSKYIFAITAKLPDSDVMVKARAFAEKHDGTIVYSGLYGLKLK